MTKTTNWSFKDAATVRAFLDNSFKSYFNVYTRADLFQILHYEAEQGNLIMQQLLGMCYVIGYGCEVNPEEAINWWKSAATQGE